MTPEPPDLELRSAQGTTRAFIAIVQHGRAVPRTGDRILLEPGPFRVRVRGDVRDVSFFAAKGPQVQRALSELNGPLVTHAGSTAAHNPHEVHFSTQPMWWSHGQVAPIADRERLGELAPVLFDTDELDVGVAQLETELGESFERPAHLFGYGRGYLYDLEPPGSSRVQDHRASIEINTVQGVAAGECVYISWFMQDQLSTNLTQLQATPLTLCFEEAEQAHA